MKDNDFASNLNQVSIFIWLFLNIRSIKCKHADCNFLIDLNFNSTFVLL